MLKYYNSLVEPYSDTQDRSFDVLFQRALSDPEFVTIATYEIQRSTYDGGCLLRAAKQDLSYNDGALAFPKDSPYPSIFTY